MFLGRVIGSVVSTRKSERLTGAKLLIVDPVDFEHQKGENRPLVAVDSVGAGEGEIVLVVQGSSARLTDASKDSPTDATIMAIVDSVDFAGRRTFSKS